MSLNEVVEDPPNDATLQYEVVEKRGLNAFNPPKNFLGMLCDLTVAFAVFACLRVSMQKVSPGVRVGVIDNPSGKPSEDNTVVFRAIWASLLTQKNKVAAEFVQKLLKEETVMLLQQKTKMKDLLIQVKIPT